MRDCDRNLDGGRARGERGLDKETVTEIESGKEMGDRDRDRERDRPIMSTHPQPFSFSSSVLQSFLR